MLKDDSYEPTGSLMKAVVRKKNKIILKKCECASYDSYLLMYFMCL